MAAAVNRAETLRSQVLADALSQPPRAAGLSATAAQLKALGHFCEAHGLGATAVAAAAAATSREPGGGVEPMLTRAALHLWVYFDARCAQLADQVPLVGLQGAFPCLPSARDGTTIALPSHAPQSRNTTRAICRAAKACDFVGAPQPCE